MYAGHLCSGRQSPWPENRRGRELHVPSLYRENSESATIAKLSCTGPNRESLARTGLYAPATMFLNSGRRTCIPGIERVVPLDHCLIRPGA